MYFTLSELYRMVRRAADLSPFHNNGICNILQRNIHKFQIHWKSWKNILPLYDSKKFPMDSDLDVLLVTSVLNPS
jgi:hypothetical protein